MRIKEQILQINLYGIRTNSVENNLIPGSIFSQHLEQIINDTETSIMERNIHIQTNQGEQITNRHKQGIQFLFNPLTRIDLRYNYIKLQDRGCRRSVVGCTSKYLKEPKSTNNYQKKPKVPKSQVSRSVVGQQQEGR